MIMIKAKCKVWHQPLLVAGEKVVGYNVSLKESTSTDDIVFVYGYITQNTSITLDSLDPYQEYSICVRVLTDGATEIPTISASFMTLGGKLVAKVQLRDKKSLQVVNT